MNYRILILIVVLGVAGLLSYSVIKSSEPGSYDDFAKCLTSKGIFMGGTNTCSYCNKQKDLFGNSFKYVDYHNCDYERAWCNSKGVVRYPTWVFPDGVKYTGEQSLHALSTLSGCKLEYKPAA